MMVAAGGGWSWGQPALPSALPLRRPRGRTTTRARRRRGRPGASLAWCPAAAAPRPIAADPRLLILLLLLMLPCALTGVAPAASFSGPDAAAVVPLRPPACLECRDARARRPPNQPPATASRPLAPVWMDEMGSERVLAALLECHKVGTVVSSRLRSRKKQGLLGIFSTDDEDTFRQAIPSIPSPPQSGRVGRHHSIGFGQAGVKSQG